MLTLSLMSVLDSVCQAHGEWISADYSGSLATINLCLWPVVYCVYRLVTLLQYCHTYVQ